jgi:hypothetical protein
MIIIGGLFIAGFLFVLIGSLVAAQGDASELTFYSTRSSHQNYFFAGAESPTFEDVPTSYWAYAWIEALYDLGITMGCSTSPMQYCPEDAVSRAQMAIFLVRSMHGVDFVPPDATGEVFSDVPSDAFAADWIEALFADGVTSGCGDGKYCPDAFVTRAEMAIFLLRAKYGHDYEPDPIVASTGFLDVAIDDFAANWIKQLADEGITTGCGNGNYCPAASVTRAAMAVFLIRTFRPDLFPQPTPQPTVTSTIVPLPGQNQQCKTIGNAQICATISEANPSASSGLLTVRGRLLIDGEPQIGLPMNTTWHFPGEVSTCDDGITNPDGIATCNMTLPNFDRRQKINIDVTIGEYTVTTWFTTRAPIISPTNTPCPP